MCISFIRISTSRRDRYKLIILNNRDEVLDRPTSQLHWENGILAGIDEQDPARGTWFGCNQHGKVGILLSITQPPLTKILDAQSRGKLVKDFLSSNVALSDYTENIQKEAENYNGFQFLGLQRTGNGLFTMESVTNRMVLSPRLLKWDGGCHVISNSPPDQPLKKVLHGQKIFETAMTDVNSIEESTLISRLLEIGNDRTKCLPDPQLGVQTGIEDENLYAPLGSVCVRYPSSHRYGTRTHSILLVDQNDNAKFYETTITDCKEDVESSVWSETVEEFKLL